MEYFIMMLFGMTLDPVLVDRANERACIVQENFSHEGINTSFKGTTYKYIGENLAKGYDSDYEAMVAFINSPTHLEQFLNGYTNFGVGRCGYYMAVIMAK